MKITTEQSILACYLAEMEENKDMIYLLILCGLMING